MKTLRTIYDQLLAQHAPEISGDAFRSFSDKGNVHTYIEYYEKYFEPYRSECSILEIGVMTGGSMLLWSQYFDSVFLTGVDIRPGFSTELPFQKDLELVTWNWKVDSTDPAQTPDLKQYRFVIDDGAHDLESQFKTFCNYWQFVQPGGVYFVEDIETEHNQQVLEAWIREWLSAQKISFEIEAYRGPRTRRDDQILAIKRV